MNHIKVEVIANEYQQEELIALLDDYKATGFEQTDEKLLAFFNEDNFDKEGVMSVLRGYGVQIETLQETNWNEEWERNFSPVVVDDFVAVRAHFHAPIENTQYQIIITPKMSFGTGHHATTFLMMKGMWGLNFHGKTVFDFGTGTGILAIFAQKLGAEDVTAIDVDDWSIENAKENFERNDCHGIDVSLSSNLPKRTFDVVLANINRNVILNYMHRLSAILLDNGVILFSGLLIADESGVVSLAQNFDLLLKDRQEREGWISLLFVKQG